MQIPNFQNKVIFYSLGSIYDLSCGRFDDNQGIDGVGVLESNDFFSTNRGSVTKIFAKNAMVRIFGRKCEFYN